MVRSLYFDTFYNNDYMDKENGIENRRKIRLRMYDPKSNTIKLELKEKFGSSQIKRSISITKDIALKLMKGNYSCLRTLQNDFADELFYIMQTEFYRPKCVVEYNRLAYIVPENNIRITIDRDLKATEANMDIFSSSLNLYPVSSEIVLEVKYNNFLLDYVKDIINIIDKSETSMSKYCISRQISCL
jgi:hypothetical protein